MLIVSALALAIIVNLIAPWLAWRWTRQPFMGAFLGHTLVVSTTQGVGRSGLPPELINPNRVLEANGQPIQNQADLSRILSAIGVGNLVSYTLECLDSAGGWEKCRVTLPVTAFPLRDFLTLFWLPYLIGLVYLAAGIWVYRLKGDTPGGQAFALFGASLAIFTGSFFDMLTNHRFVRLWTASMSVIAASGIHLALVFPEERGLVRRYPHLRFLPYLPSLSLIVLSEFYLFNDNPRAYFPLWRWNYTYIGLAILAFFLMLLYVRLRPTSGVIKQQAKIILLGSIIAFAPIALWVTLASFQFSVPFRAEFYFPSLIIFPISITYAVLRYRLLDVDLMISRGLVYSLLTITVIGFYFVLVNLLGQLFHIASPASNPLILATFVLILAIFLNPLRERLQRAVDRIFYKDRLDYRQALQDFSRTLTATLKLPLLFDVLLKRVRDLMHTERAMIFLFDEDTGIYITRRASGMSEQAARFVRFDRNNQTVRWLAEREQPLYLAGEEGRTYPPRFPAEEKARLSALGVSLCVPLKAKAHLIGWLALGPKPSGDLYSRDDLAFLTALADQTTIALDNAQLYERTEKRARELATLIEVGQTIASTLDLQTVLNTIMTKAVEILDVEAGSLLLMDEKGEKLVFQVALGPISDVFDSIRVPLGTGIAGTVAQKGTSLIVNDAQLDPRWWVGVDKMTRFSTRSILCVPLISKEQVIGVIEIINKRDSSPFNEEELNLLSSFAAQAAIAIENARLYTMTDQALAKRVEELSIMQEIDRQLNATLDFDQVMDLTLEWALQITGSKTGALAIVDQERNGMLLLANRGYPPEYDRYRQQPWPLDQGIVGRVVRTGQPALVSDVSQDPDYVKAIAETRSQLTVPILREDQVSGVINLESPELAGFNEDDLAFVMRLADHAAIAIENAKLYADVKRANEAKSDFVSFVSHELKISMTSIKGYAKLLDMGTAGEVSEAQRDFLRVITSNVDHMDALVRDLLDLSRIETGRLRLKKEPVAIQTLVQKVLQAVQGEIEARELNLTLDVPEDLPLVWGDQARLTQVITNLMSNAYKYTPAGGSIAIKCQVSSGAVQEPSDRDFVTISVSDTGIGISAEDQARVFTEFFRADDPLVQEAGGTGLGLSITKRLVEMHGGRIWFESEPGQGSTFHIALPLATDDAQAKPPKF